MPAPTEFIGGDCAAYINTGTFGSKVWKLLKKVKDLDRPDERDKADASNRGNPFRSFMTGKRTAGVTGTLQHNTTDEASVAMLDAYEANSVVEICFMDAPGGAASEGKIADWQVAKYNRKEPLAESTTVEFELVLNDANGRGRLSDYTFPS